MKILLHTCCGPCSVYCIDRLKELNIELDAYWYNPNIHPYMEYKQRRDTLVSYTESIGIKAIVNENYGLVEFTKSVIGDLENRCQNYCYRVRLEETAKFAKENGYDAFSTTLLISPYQKHDLLKQIGEEMAEKYGIPFFYEDFRPGFRQGQAKARELGLYMQKYCGCVFSEQQIIFAHTNNKPKLPEGFEFLPVTRNIVIRKEKENTEKYINILLGADPNEDLIRQYLKDGEVFVLTYKENVACVAVITKIDNETIELKNIVTKEEYRGQGLGKKMLKYLADNYKSKYKKMLVGTSENNIPFYVKQGFDKYEKTIKNFFVDNYKEEIWDGNLHCIDMYYYSKDLSKKCSY